MDEVATYLAGPSLKNWQDNFTEPMKALMNERIDDLTRTFKSKKQAETDLLRQDWFNEYIINFAQPINATTEEAIRRLVKQGISEGWSIPTMQAHLEMMFQQWMTGGLSPAEFEWLEQRLPEYRAGLIIRTETIKALNIISYRLYGFWGIKEHEWVAIADNRTRPDHRDADGQIAKIGKPFNIGGWPMLYPGDPAGPPEQIINCRCVTVPRV